MKKVLVTAIGSFSADIVIKNLKKNKYTVMGCDIYPEEWIADAANVSRFYHAPYATSTEEYLHFIREICEKEEICMVMPLTDVEVDVLTSHREWFEEHGIILGISSAETIALCRNKKRMQEYIDEHCPETKTIPTCWLQETEKEQVTYPLVCKPTDGRSSQGLCYVHNEEEWKHFLQSAEGVNYIVQPYVEGKIVTVDIVRQADGKKAVAIPRMELLRTLNGAGTSVYVFQDEALIAQSIRLAHELKIIGCVNFEFIKDNEGGYHFIECNPRFSGGVEFSCIAGYDCVSNHVRAFVGQPIDDQPVYRNQYIARKYEEYVTAVE